MCNIARWLLLSSERSSRRCISYVIRIACSYPTNWCWTWALTVWETRIPHSAQTGHMFSHAATTAELPSLVHGTSSIPPPSRSGRPWLCGPCKPFRAAVPWTTPGHNEEYLPVRISAS
ncbi:hypothetical protein WOLCODRAFT_107751, partial [Wolfiporia cocos MD-104 SS10]